MAVLTKEIVFCIITYKEDYRNCASYQTLCKSYKNAHTENDLHVYVFDNTPDNLNTDFRTEFEGVKVNYFTKGKNKGLAFAYNFLGNIAFKEGFKRMVLLDQDTDLPVDIYGKYKFASSEYKIWCPKVFDDGNLMSPSRYVNYRSYPIKIDNEVELELKDISLINSGMMIDLPFFNQIGGYNSNLFLDFCDHDFIIKVKRSQKKIGLIDCELHQDFSATSHTKEQALIRYKIFVTDLKVFYKNKSKLKIFYYLDLPHLIKLCYRFRTLQFLAIRAN